MRKENKVWPHPSGNQDVWGQCFDEGTHWFLCTKNELRTVLYQISSGFKTDRFELQSTIFVIIVFFVNY